MRLGTQSQAIRNRAGFSPLDKTITKMTKEQLAEKLAEFNQAVKEFQAANRYSSINNPLHQFKGALNRLTEALRIQGKSRFIVHKATAVLTPKTEPTPEPEIEEGVILADNSETAEGKSKARKNRRSKKDNEEI